MEIGDKITVHNNGGIYKFLRHEGDMFGISVIATQGEREFRFDLNTVSRYGTPDDIKERKEQVLELFQEKADLLTMDTLAEIENLINNQLRE